MAPPALLDTHSFLWFITGSPRLSVRARALIESGENAIFVSAVSLWEIAIKSGLRKLTLDLPFDVLIPRELDRQQIGVLAIEVAHLAQLTRLPLHHRDPFDRLLAAQALTDGFAIVSIDRALDPYGVDRIW